LKKEGKPITKIILFTAVGIVFMSVVCFVIDFGVKHSDDAQLGKINRLANHGVDPQIIAFGSSAGEVSIDPDIIESGTGLTCFNSCINGTRFLQYEGLINEFDEYSKNNKIVILSEAYFSFEKISALASIEQYLPHLSNTNVYHSLFMVQPDLTWKCRYIPFYKYIAVSHTYYKNSVIGWKNFLYHREPTGGGYFPVNRGWEPDADAAIASAGHFDISIDPLILDQYVQTIKKIQGKGRKVILMLTPVFGEMLKKVTDITPLRMTLDSLAAATHVTFFDFTTSTICKDKSLFYNSNHLNLTGSRIFSRMLADSLKRVM
jgi:hypothetical protein